MKRLFLLPMLMLGLSFACDQPYEEVAGIKVGCPFEGDLSKGIVQNDDERIISYEMGLQDNFFDSVEIRTLDGNIEWVSFTKQYQDLAELRKDRDILFQSLENKWGEAKLIGDEDLLIVSSINEPRSDVLDVVLASQMPGGRFGYLGANYSSKKLKEYSDLKEEQENTRKSKQLEGF